MSVVVGVMGAGAIGCWLGGKLAAEGVRVVLVGRERLGREIAEHGLNVVDRGGARVTLRGSEHLAFASDVGALAPCDVVLCAVKSGQTAAVAVEMASVLRADALVVSMQNGVRNPELLRAGLGDRIVLGGIVGFNVISRPQATFQRTTSGPLAIEASDDRRARNLEADLVRAGIDVERPRAIAAKQWSKLMMNLANSVSALSGAPTRELVLDAGYRRIVAAVIAEALAVLRVAKIRPARLGALPVHVFPWALRLPTGLVRVVARAQLAIDPEARSSMWEDLEKRRPTEVDFLNGEIVRLAEAHGTRAPLNAKLVELVHAAEGRSEGSPRLSADALRAALPPTM